PQHVDNLRIILQRIPWKFLFLLPALVIIAIPVFAFGTHLGGQILPSLTSFFYTITGPVPSVTPTPLPPLSTVLPQVGPVLYTVQEGDSCDSILTFQMHMEAAGQIFSDVKPETVKALNAVMGHDCHNIHPGTVLSLLPHYPLAALGGVVQKIEAVSPKEVLPTPLIHVTREDASSVDCSRGCLLTVRIAPQVEVRMQVKTGLPVRVGSWVWAQARLARKPIAGFADYPYVDPAAPLNGMTVQACDLQVDNTHDDQGTPCDALQPNTIDIDGGAWLLGVTGPGALDHWRYPLRLPVGTRVLLWLSADHNGNLKFQPGNPIYRYDEDTHTYVKI
ncbi:MAG: hypothetical protein IMW89_16865, partial [Ktedonobacteraceae bacterium]|nr:hypothetical protein [Ktedonobacteraceae bacterium]